MTIILPLGPTDNRRHTIHRWKRRIIDTEVFRSWKVQAIDAVEEQLPKRFKPFAPTFKNQMHYLVKVVLPDKRTDGANQDKGLRDVLTKAGVWTDDKWMLPVFDKIEIDKLNPRIEVTIYDETKA